MGKKIALILAGAAIIFSAIILCVDYRQKQSMEKEYDRYQEKIIPLETKKRELENEIKQLEQKALEETRGAGTVTLMFTDLDAIVYDEIRVDMQAYEMQGMLMLSEEQFPGMEGCITREQFDEMTEQGFEYCLAWNGQGELSAWLDEIEKKLKDNDLEQPETLYITEGTCDEEQEAMLKERGIRTVITLDKAGKPGEIAKIGDSVWHLVAFPFHVSGGKTSAQNVAVSGGNILFTIGRKTEEEMYRKESMENLLDQLKTWRDNDGLQIMTVKDAYLYRRGLDEHGEEINIGIQGQIQSLREEIETLDAEIRKLDAEIAKVYDADS